MTLSFKSQSTCMIQPTKARFNLTDYYQSIMVCSSLVLAYFYKIWPFLCVIGYIVLKKTLYWTAVMADKKRVDMTMSPYVFYLTYSDSKWREFWMTLSKVFNRMHQMITPSDCMPPPPLFLSRSNTMYYGDSVYSTSLGNISVQEYENIRSKQYKKYFTIVSVCILMIVSTIIYYFW
jgi:hypothetical protein